MASIALTLFAGRNSPPVLTLLFCGWVLSPFLFLLMIDSQARRWSTATQKTMHGTALAISVASIVVYGVATFTATKPRTPVFLLVPAFTWIAAGIALAISAAATKRNRA